MQTRKAELSDAQALALIYNQGIEDRVGTFETRLRTSQDIMLWFDSIHPIVVAEDETGVIAFAAASSYRNRDCYDGVAECSTYVRRDRRGIGAGRAVLSALINESEKRGFWKLLSRIFVENTASRALIRSVGFREVGIYRNHGKLDGQWRDVVIVEMLLPNNLK